MTPEIAQRLLAALEDLVLNANEAMKTGGWVPTPLHSSFWDAVVEANDAVKQAKAAPQARAAQPLTDERKQAMFQAANPGNSESSRAWYFQGIRDGERAHGIGKEGGAA